MKGQGEGEGGEGGEDDEDEDENEDWLWSIVINLWNVIAYTCIVHYMNKISFSWFIKFDDYVSPYL